MNSPGKVNYDRLCLSYVTPVRRIEGGERKDYPINVRIIGGIYNADNIPHNASLLRRQFTKNLQAHDKQHVINRLGALLVPGVAIYGGFIFEHFGHFLLETLARAWYIKDTHGDVYFHNAPENKINNVEQLLPWQRDIFKALVGNVSRIKFIDTNMLFDELVVPDPGVVSREFCVPNQANALKLIGINVTAQSSIKNIDPEKVWLSRAFWKKGRIHGEIEFEQALQQEGFFICRPELFTIAQQIQLFENASFVAGFTGSAFHTVLLAKNNGAQLLHFLRINPLNENYLICSEVSGFKSHYFDFFEGFDNPLNSTIQPERANVFQDFSAIWRILHSFGLVANARYQK